LAAAATQVEAHASGGFYQEGKSVDDLAGEAEGYRARGFQGSEDEDRQLRDAKPSAPSGGSCRAVRVEPEEDIARLRRFVRHWDRRQS
jgi:hypothetical protein